MKAGALWSLIIAGLALGAAPIRADAGQTGRAGISIVDHGPDSGGVRRFTLFADSEEIASVLKALFARTGDEYVIDQDVVGPLDLKLKNATAEEILRQISQTTRPPLRIRREGRLIRISRDTSAPVPAADPRVPPGVGGYLGVQNPQRGPLGGYVQGIGSSAPVTLQVPRDRPIPLADALARMSQQTGFPILLDRRVPRQVTFSGTITAAPLSLVLQTIADTSGLKLILSGAQATLVPPDEFVIRANDAILGVYSAQTCAKCKARIAAEWRYCPHCGQPVSAPETAPARNPGGVVPARKGTSAGKIPR